MHKEHFRKCIDCKNIYQTVYITKTTLLTQKEKDVWHKDPMKVQANICDRCDNILSHGLYDKLPVYCKYCDRLMTTHTGCPKCKSPRCKELGFFDSEPIVF